MNKNISKMRQLNFTVFRRIVKDLIRILFFFFWFYYCLMLCLEFLSIRCKDGATLLLNVVCAEEVFYKGKIRWEFIDSVKIMSTTRTNDVSCFFNDINKDVNSYAVGFRALSYSFSAHLYFSVMCILWYFIINLWWNLFKCQISYLFSLLF